MGMIYPNKLVFWIIYSMCQVSLPLTGTGLAYASAAESQDRYSLVVNRQVIINVCFHVIHEVS